MYYYIIVFIDRRRFVFTAINRDPKKIRCNGTPCRSLSLGNFYSHTCIRNNGIKPRGAMPPLCGKFTIKLAKSPTTSRPSARPAYETQMVIVNRKSVFFSLPPDRVCEKCRSLFILCRCLVASNVRTELFVRGAAVFPRSFTHILHPRKASATAKSLSFTYHGSGLSSTISRTHFCIGIRHYSNNLVSPFAWIIIRTTIFVLRQCVRIISHYASQIIRVICG